MIHAAKYSKVDIPFGTNEQMFVWCEKNIGHEYTDWFFSSNAHHHIFFIKDPEKATLFALKWK